MHDEKILRCSYSTSSCDTQELVHTCRRLAMTNKTGRYVELGEHSNHILLQDTGSLMKNISGLKDSISTVKTKQNEQLRVKYVKRPSAVSPNR